MNLNKTDSKIASWRVMCIKSIKTLKQNHAVWQLQNGRLTALTQMLQLSPAFGEGVKILIGLTVSRFQLK